MDTLRPSTCQQLIASFPGAVGVPDVISNPTIRSDGDLVTIYDADAPSPVTSPVFKGYLSDPYFLERLRSDLARLCYNYHTNFICEPFLHLCGAGAWNLWRFRIRKSLSIDVGPRPATPHICRPPSSYPGVPLDVPYFDDLFIKEGTLLTLSEIEFYASKYVTSIPLTVSNDSSSPVYTTSMTERVLAFSYLNRDTTIVTGGSHVAPSDSFLVAKDVYLSTTYCNKYTLFDPDSEDRFGDLWGIVNGDTVFCRCSLINSDEKPSMFYYKFQSLSIIFGKSYPDFTHNYSPVFLHPITLEVALDVFKFYQPDIMARLLPKSEIQGLLLSHQLMV